MIRLLVKRLLIRLFRIPSHEHSYTIEREIAGEKFFQCDFLGCMVHVPDPAQEKSRDEAYSKYQQTLRKKSALREQMNQLSLHIDQTNMLKERAYAAGDIHEFRRLIDEITPLQNQYSNVLREYTTINDTLIQHLQHCA